MKKPINPYKRQDWKYLSDRQKQSFKKQYKKDLTKHFKYTKKIKK